MTPKNEFKKGSLKKLAALILTFVVLSLLMFMMLVSGQASFPSVNVSLINITDSNASLILSNQQLFWYANYSNNITGRTEENSTFKWFINNTNQSGVGNRTAELKPIVYKDAVGYWHLDENGGTSGYADSSGFGNVGSPNGNVTNVTGLIRGGVSFTGQRFSFVGISDSNSLDLATNLTISAWIMPVRRQGASAETILTKGSWAYYTELETDGRFGVYLTGAANPGVHKTNQVIPLGVWSHVAWTYDNASVKLYVNGELDKNVTAVNGSITVTAGAARIGSLGDLSAGYEFNGSIDEVAVYNHSLTPSEIKQLYLRTWYDFSPQLFLLQANNVTGFNTSDNEVPTTVGGAILQPGKYVDNLSADSTAPNGNVTGYWRFDAGGSTTTANDTSIFGNDGTFNGNMRWVNDSAGGLALQFDGSAGTFVNMSNPPTLTTAGGLTVEAWVKPRLRGLANSIIGKGESDANEEIVFAIWTSGQILLDVGSAQYNETPTGITFNDTWQHIAATHQSGGGVLIYLNGVRQASVGAASSGKISGTAASFEIGASRGQINLFNGSIDEVRIINRTLTAAEIVADYRAGAKGLGLLSNDYINYSATGNFNEREGTVEFWVKPEWNYDDNVQHSFFDTEVTNDLHILKDQGGLFNNDLSVYINNPQSYIMLYDVKWLKGNWHNVALTWNNYTSNMTLHIDGVVVNNSKTAFVIPAPKSFLIGSTSEGAPRFYPNATFSEYRISRKALTTQEINHSFSKSRQFFQNEYLLNRSNYAKGDALRLEYLPSDSSNATGNKTNSSTIYIQNVAPAIPVINTPTANSYNTTSTVTWNASTDFDGDVITYRVYVNGTFNGSTTATSLALNMTPERTYAVNVSAFDDSDDSGNSSQIQFVFDNLAPRLDNGSNSDNTTKFVNRNWTFLNFTFTEPFNATAFILNTSGSTTMNTTPTISSGYFYRNFTNLTDGSYLFRGWMNDTVGNAAQTAQINITVDTTTPIIENATISATELTSGNPYTTTINISENNKDTATVTINSANYTMTCTPTQCSYTFQTPQGTDTTYIITDYYINDTASNTAQNKTIFTIHTTPHTTAGSNPPPTAGAGPPTAEANETTTAAAAAKKKIIAAPKGYWALIFPTNQQPVTWEKKVRTNKKATSCEATNDFTCETEPNGKSIIISKKHAPHNQLIKTYTTTLKTNTSDNTTQTQSLNLNIINPGITLPINIPLPNWLNTLTSPTLTQKTEQGKVQIRWLTLLLIAALPTITTGAKIRKHHHKKTKGTTI